jgi:hypothetical protein
MRGPTVIDLLLLHPPVSLACEPPLGLATLAARLTDRGLKWAVLDANIESLTFLIKNLPPSAPQNTTDHRALLSRERSLAALRQPDTYQNLDRHHSATSCLNHCLHLAGRRFAEAPIIGLANYHDPTLSPLNSYHLIAAAQSFAQSPFFPYFQTLLPRIIPLSPRLLGLSVNYLHQALPAMALAGFLHTHLPECPIVLGGALFRCWHDRLQPSSLQPVIEQIFFDDGSALLDLLAGSSSPRDGSCLPNFSWVPWEQYLAPGRIVPFATSNGCFWGRCRYCPEALQPTIFSAHPPALLPRFLDELRRQTDPILIHLTDSALPPAALEILSKQQWSARWYGFSRFIPQLTDADFCRNLRRSGCQLLQLGLESGSPRVLRRLRKGINLRQASTALHQLADADLGVFLYVMFGTPGETLDDAQRTMAFVIEHAPLIRCLNISLLNLPAQSPAEPDLQLAPLAGPLQDLSLYQRFSCETGWDRRQARHFMERVFARHEAIAQLLHQTPLIFGANHAPFFP